MMESYQEMITNIKANICTSIKIIGKAGVLEVIDTLIGTKAVGAASSSGINDPPAQGNMQIG